MRRIISSIVLLSAFLLFGCNNTVAPTSTTSLPDGSMAATIDGSYWQSTSIPLVSGGAAAIRKLSVGTISIVGTKINNTSDQQVMTINLSRLGTGTDTLGIKNIASYSIGKGSDQTWGSVGLNAGIATVTTYDTVNKTISGTFNFTAVNTALTLKTVTSGTFKNVPWKDQ
jgi:hypothetical protein